MSSSSISHKGCCFWGYTVRTLSMMKSDIYPYFVPLAEQKCIFPEKQKSRKYAV